MLKSKPLSMIRAYPWRLVYPFALREFKSRLSDSVFALILVVLLPLAMLGVYALVFGLIFESRAPKEFDYPFVVWLGLGLWPWLAFSESVLTASQSIRSHATLLSKLPLPRSLFVLTTVIATFCIHLVGYCVVVIVFDIWTVNIRWLGLPYAVLVLASLFILSLGLGLLVSALVVFFRDLDQLLPVVFMLGFFLTPILYSPEFLPEPMKVLLSLNPLTLALEELKQALLFGKVLPGYAFFAFCSISTIIFLSSLWLFERLNPFFEDYL